MEWDTVIGLEVHIQLKTKSKLFSGASTTFGSTPNSQTCFIDAGLPGVLPVLNQEAVIMAIRFGLAIQAEIQDQSIFERKNYFYPDLPKGYQISQFQKPIISNGKLTITLKDGSEKEVLIARAHLEEDAGKSLHGVHAGYSGIDLNRAGTPLLEIVTTPCLFSSHEAVSYLKKLHQLVQFLDICDGNMQEGNFRCDVNLSLKPKDSSTLGTRTELKNLNSFRFIEKAIAYEQARHMDLLESGQQVTQETRLYNPDTHTTHAMRSKENENDYRYFPDPDLLPIQIPLSLISEVKNNLPDLPDKIYLELKNTPSLNEEDINFILSSPATYYFYKEIKTQSHAPEKMIINWLKGQYTAALNEENLTFDTPRVAANIMANLLNKLQDNIISLNHARTIFTLLWSGEKDIETIIEREGFRQSDNTALWEEMIAQLIKQYPEQVADYRSGKEKLLAFFIGQIMKQTKGKANPEQINLLLKKRLSGN
ncbi:Asp-tRNA(Asn)/Glu-tRNA(Gln) amidotransferase subunit GatB [Legionella cincinnatiensis]|uniref:Aspartyl/glutamyl-tRNA(Asn/Gln) amidotransferase subunit B n=1 Tax=Legionella cincinnatiensis TaxID=28085 RepID=A0A378IJE9_9GAMM|nr:Asp-tRNA(Asn)/Glu-tRNA(Gln) amidotransferase subunit GatB [Legionella cincinnatiensis]KTC81813.1 glutamyl-tRNA(Gln) amidotransferase subunit B [Legionella cincinnatiensis]STX34621.1 glutamyl-tRNA(Gln) amidotransferase subunit B [Legionella cincinnatiensis]